MKYLYRSIIFGTICYILSAVSSVSALAGDSFPTCLLTNPCDCDPPCGDIEDDWPSTTKTFRGKTIAPQHSSYRSNCICPPYNKTDGRRGCLLKREPPEIFNVAYINICAEESPESNYFSPKIRYRNQTCNIACWTLKGDLDGDGECTIIPTPYGAPLVRLCARMAMPEDRVNDQPADDGYTPDKHLDFEGYWVDDFPVSHDGFDKNGNPTSTPDPNLQRPKICMYWDPDLLSTLLSYAVGGQTIAVMTPLLLQLGADVPTIINSIFNPDLIDVNPVHQSEHRTTKISIVFQIIIDMIEGGISIISAINNLLEKYPWLYFLAGPAGAPAIATIDGLSRLAVIIAEAGALPALKFLGSLNRVVGVSFGCVNVPLGPFPPPYCPYLPRNISTPSVFPICQTTALNNGTRMLQRSTRENPCKVGNAVCATPIPFGLCMNPYEHGERNNVVHNLIRVGFTDNKPLCKGESTSDGKCININGTLTASSLHANNNGTGTIKLCKTIPASKGETPCVESEYLLHQYPAGAPIPDFRVLYTIGSADAPTEYYDESIPNCPTADQHCQVTWGVNVGSFADLAVIFPQQDDNENPKWSPSVTLLDTNKNQHTFQAAITRSELTVGSDSMTPQEPDQICVYQKLVTGDVTIGCNTRAIPPRPKVRSCEMGGLCTSSSADPRMILKLEVPTENGSDFTEGAIGTTNGLNLAGYYYGAYATDKSFVKKPFSGPRAILNGSSIFGNYLNDVPPYSVRGDIDNSAIYLNGVEYLNDVYQYGAQYLCLTGYKFDDCLSGQTRQNCVLAALLNSDVMSCYAFNGIMTKYPSINVCNRINPTLSCDYNAPIESYDGKNNNKITIIPCVSKISGLTTYCYDYGAQNGPLCEISKDSTGRIVPNTKLDVLSNGFKANVDYYDYTPGIEASNTRTFSNVSANATIAQTILQKATALASGNIAFQYKRDTCTPSTTKFYTNDMIQACTSARTVSAKVTAICTQTTALLTDKASALYKQLSNICSTVQTNITNILQDQYSTQLLSQMQNDAGYATTEMSNLITVIKNFTGIPNLVTNIVKAEQDIYSSTNAITYPTPASKINAICSQAQSLVSDKLISPMIYDAIDTACTIAKTKPLQASLDTLHQVISGDPQNAAIPGIAQYNIANDGGATLTPNKLANQVAPGDYIAPDFDTMIVRNRTDLENGLCIAIPQPGCTATTPMQDQADGNAIWNFGPTPTEYGNQLIGTCQNGYTKNNNLDPVRYCLIDRNSGNTFWSQVYNVCGESQCIDMPSIVVKLNGTNDRQYHPAYEKFSADIPQCNSGTQTKFNILDPNAQINQHILNPGTYTTTISFTPLGIDDNAVDYVRATFAASMQDGVPGTSMQVLNGNDVICQLNAQNASQGCYNILTTIPKPKGLPQELIKGQRNTIKVIYTVPQGKTGMAGITMSLTCVAKVCAAPAGQPGDPVQQPGLSLEDRQAQHDLEYRSIIDAWMNDPANDNADLAILEKILKDWLDAHPVPQ